MASVKAAPKTPFAFETSPSKPRDDSFSTYLALVRENFPPECGDSAPERLSCQISLNRRRTLDGEIDIFDAEKYFSGVMDADVPQAPENRLGTPVKNEAKLRMRSRSRTGSTASSETSCNSRSMLLRNHHRKYPAVPSEQLSEANSKRFLGVFPCSCSRKNAIDVNKEALADACRLDNLKKHGRDEHLVSDLRLKRISPGLEQAPAFAFPPYLNWAVGKGAFKEGKVIEGAPKAVFGAKLFEKGDMAASQRSMLASGKIDDDVRSDASSDLFEIESLSMKNSFMAGHEGESLTATGYEPSEASVEWSVVTASVANFSIASESDDQRAKLRKARRASGSGLLLGCVSEKAVSVTAASANNAKMAVRTGLESRRELAGPDGPVTPTARYRVESCGVEVGSGRGAGRVLPPSPFCSSRSSQD